MLLIFLRIHLFLSFNLRGPFVFQMQHGDLQGFYFESGRPRVFLTWLAVGWGVIAVYYDGGINTIDRRVEGCGICTQIEMTSSPPFFAQSPPSLL